MAQIIGSIWQNSNLKLKKVGKTTRPFRYDLNQIPYDSVQSSSVSQSCLTLCDPMDCNMAGFPVHHQLPEIAHIHVHWVRDVIKNHFILCRPFILLPSIIPSIRVFPNELVLPIRWAKHWRFSFSISPSKEYSWLIPFRMNWLDLLAVQGTL